jgi:hypothetical protein
MFCFCLLNYEIGMIFTLRAIHCHLRRVGTKLSAGGSLEQFHVIVTFRALNASLGSILLGLGMSPISLLIVLSHGLQLREGARDFLNVIGAHVTTNDTSILHEDSALVTRIAVIDLALGLRANAMVHKVTLAIPALVLFCAAILVRVGTVRFHINEFSHGTNHWVVTVSLFLFR